MTLDLSKVRVALVGMEPLLSEKLEAMLCADVRIAKQNISIEAGLIAFESLLDQTSFDVIIVGNCGCSRDAGVILQKILSMAPATAVIYVSNQEDVRLTGPLLMAGVQDVINEHYVNGMLLTKAVVHGMERARMRAELRAKNQKLISLNEEMNRFLGMAAHDLRGPIGIIGGFAELVLEQASKRLDSDHIAALETIRRSSKSMVRLIEELLDVSRIESGKHELKLARVRFCDLIDQCLQRFTRTMQIKKIAIETQCQSDILIRVDHDKITQVMDNLLSNALKFSPEGGKVKVEARASSEGVEVRVQDWGPGIPAGEIDKIFSPFFRGSAQPTAGESSTGLGLPIVKGIIHEHGGELGVESECGFGSTFWFRLPHSLGQDKTRLMSHRSEKHDATQLEH